MAAAPASVLALALQKLPHDDQPVLWHSLTEQPVVWQQQPAWLSAVLLRAVQLHPPAFLPFVALAGLDF